MTVPDKPAPDDVRRDVIAGCRATPMSLVATTVPIFRIAAHLGRILAGGVVIYFFFGMFGITVGEPPPNRLREQYVAGMQSQLKLTDKQLAKLNHVLDGSSERLRKLHRKEGPELRAILDMHAQKIRAMLTPEQQVAYEKMKKR